MPAKTYHELPVEDWNVRCFHAFIADKHEEILGVSYQPGRSWQAEVGLLGDIIGTQKKPAQYDKAMIREFIIRCLHDYKPKPGYRGFSFMNMWGWRKNILQELEYEYAQKAKEAARVDDDLEGMEEWL